MQPIRYSETSHPRCYREASNFVIVINPKLKIDTSAQQAILRKLFYNIIGDK